MKRLKADRAIRVLFICICSAIIITLLSSFWIWRRETAQRIKDAEGRMLQMEESIESISKIWLQEMDTAAFRSAINTTVIKWMTRANTEEDTPGNNLFLQNVNAKDSVLKELVLIDMPQLDMDRISVFNQQGDYIDLSITPDFFTSQEEIEDYLSSDGVKKLFERFAGDKSYLIEAWKRDPVKLDFPQSMICVYRPVFNYDTDIMQGIVQVQRRTQKLERLLGQTEDQSFSFAILDQFGTPVYISPQLEEDVTAHLSEIPVKEEVQRCSYDWFQGLILSCRMDMGEWQIFLLAGKDTIQVPLLSLANIFLIAELGFVLFAAIALNMLQKQINSPLTMVRESMEKIDLNHLTLQLPQESNEIVELNQTLVDMVDRLRSSIEEMNTLRMQELKAQLKALQAQMDPHFLYNVLTVIGLMGEEAGDPRILKSCRILSDMIAYSTSYRQGENTLSDEVNYLKNYLTLIGLRYESKLDYMVEVSLTEEELSVHLPRMLLQPIVENSIKHGFHQSKPPWIIRAILFREGEWLLFRVEDNGIGMGEEERDALKQKIARSILHPRQELGEAQIGGLGLVSTVYRLAAACGGAYRFEIMEGELGGVTILLGGKVYDQNNRRGG